MTIGLAMVDKSKKPYDWTPCDGCYSNHIMAYNTTTGEYFRPVCKSYKCEKHGWRHAKRLEEALKKYFGNFTNIRLWTFTLSSRIANDKETHAKILSKCWRYFITEVRRSRILNKNERNIQYVKVAEPHKSGYFHYHILVDQYIAFNKMLVLWESAIESVLKIRGKYGHVNVKGSKTANSAAKYVAKYVVKSAKYGMKHMKLWTKSARVSIFETKESPYVYAVYHELTKVWKGLVPEKPLNLSTFRTSSQKTTEIFLEYGTGDI